MDILVIFSSNYNATFFRRTFKDHLLSFVRHADAEVYYFNTFIKESNYLRRQSFDLIIYHYSFMATLCKNLINTYINDDLLNQLPILNLYGSMHNAVAIDFFSTEKSNFSLIFKEDLYETFFDSKKRKNQVKLFAYEISMLSLIDRLRFNYRYQFFKLKKLYNFMGSIKGKFKNNILKKRVNSSVIELINEKRLKQSWCKTKIYEEINP